MTIVVIVILCLLSMFVTASGGGCNYRFIWVLQRKCASQPGGHGERWGCVAAVASARAS
jgi:hypothetical protein